MSKEISPSPKKENLFLKKNLTILNYGLLHAVGKVDKSPYDPDYVKQKERAKDILHHYKDVAKSKKMIKSMEEMKEEEKALAETLSFYSEKTVPEGGYFSPRKGDPYTKVEAEFPQVLKSTATALNDIIAIQSNLELALRKFYDSVAELDKDCQPLAQLKEKYRILKLDFDQKLHTLNALKKQKNVETFKLYSAQQDADTAKKDMNSIYVSLSDELEYNKRKRDVEYANHLKELMTSYQEFFKQGTNIPMGLPAMSDVKLERKKIFSKEELKQTSVFGVEIDLVIEREGPTPNLIKILLFQLKKNAGKEGLFRISGEQPEIDKLKRCVDEGDYNLEWTDIHVLSNLLKLYFRQLPTPIFTFKLYQNWIDLADVLDQNSILEKIHTLFAQIPFPRRFVIGLLLDLFYDIQKAESSKMNANALAICWGNNLMRSSDPNPMFLMKETAKIHKVTEFLIRNYPKIKICFDEKWVLPEKKKPTPPPVKKALPTLPKEISGQRHESGFESPPDFDEQEFE